MPTPGMASGTPGTHLASQPSLGLALLRASECSRPGFVARPHQVALNRPWASLSLCSPLENGRHGHICTSQDGLKAEWSSPLPRLLEEGAPLSLFQNLPNPQASMTLLGVGLALPPSPHPTHPCALSSTHLVFWGPTCSRCMEGLVGLRWWVHCAVK